MPVVEFRPGIVEQTFPVEEYDLASTLDSGQAFRWSSTPDGWEGVIHGRWVRLSQGTDSLIAQAVEAGDWWWLREYLRLEVKLGEVLASFPRDDEHLRHAVESCRGLRLLRQAPWECLASFILSSTKQIVQIRRIVDGLCRRFGEPVAGPPGAGVLLHDFPTAQRIAEATERELRDCGMGFRAPYLLQTARAVAANPERLMEIRSLELEAARERLLEFPGVGRKIADCVLLFAGGHDRAFPVDVWILRALRERYFPRSRPSVKRLLAFCEEHFGPCGGHAQQYLFHYMRLEHGRLKPS